MDEEILLLNSRDNSPHTSQLCANVNKYDILTNQLKLNLFANIRENSRLFNSKSVQSIYYECLRYYKTAGGVVVGNERYINQDHIIGIDKFPSYDSLHSTMHKIHKEGTPQIPNHLNEMNNEAIPEDYRNIDGDIFLIGNILFGDINNNNANGRRILVFGRNSEHFIHKLCRSREIYCDGTFKVVPDLEGLRTQGAQLLTIHYTWNNKSIPCIYALLPNKTQAVYHTFFTWLRQFINDNALNQRWRHVMMDFEMAMKRAFIEVFPDVVVKGCFFHFCQCIYKQIQRRNQLAEAYKVLNPFNVNQYSNFNQLCKDLMALAFIHK